MSPVTITRLGLNSLTLVGDEIRFVTSGVATTENIAQEDPGLVESLVNAHRQSLAVIHESPADVHSILVDVMGIMQEDAERTCKLILPCYTQDGYIDMDTVRKSLDTLNAETGKEFPVDADDLYDFSLTRK